MSKDISAAPVSGQAAQEQAASVPEARIREIAKKAAIAVARNAGVAEQLCFPHIYLMLKDVLAAAPPAPTAQSLTDADIVQVKRAIVGLRDGWLLRAEADSAIAVCERHLSGATPALGEG